MPITTQFGQFKTSDILLNEALIGFEDNLVFQGVANMDYQNRVENDAGMPTGGFISVRTHGYYNSQRGQVFTPTTIEQDFETILINKGNMVGNLFDYNVVEAKIDRNNITDSTAYETAKNMAATVEGDVINELNLNTTMFIDGTASTDFNYDLLADGRELAHNVGIPGRQTGILNTRDYTQLNKSIRTANVFDEPLNKAVNRNMFVGRYADIDLLQSFYLLGETHISGYPTGMDLTVDSVSESDSYREGTITLSGGVDGDVLKKGDRVTLVPAAENSTNLVHNISKKDAFHPFQFVVQEDVIAAGGGIFTNVTVKPGFKTTGPYQILKNLPLAGDIARVAPSHKLNFLTVKAGLTCAFVNMYDTSTIKNVLGANVHMYDKRSEDTYAHMRLSFDYTITTNVIQMRLDTMPVYKAFLRYNVAILTAVS